MHKFSYDANTLVVVYNVFILSQGKNKMHLEG